MGTNYAGMFQPQQSVYDTWLRSQLGTGASPLQYAYQQTQSPLAQLQYWASPANTSLEGLPTDQPYREYLSGTGMFGGGSAYNPMSSQSWVDRARGIGASIGLTDMGVEPLYADQQMERAKERFGLLGGEAAARDSARLAQAPVMAGTPFALQGETQRILSRLHQDWLAQNTGGNYLQYAMTDPMGLWSRFGVGQQEATAEED